MVTLDGTYGALILTHGDSVMSGGTYNKPSTAETNELPIALVLVDRAVMFEPPKEKV